VTARTGALVLAALALAGCDGDPPDREEGAVAGCRAPAEPTPEQTEGPFYKADPPRRRSIAEPGAPGAPLMLTGRVLSAGCRPLARARVDFWQADGNGEYDNAGYRLRGYQLTDPAGRYRLETVVPAEYDGRTPHIHAKVTPAGGETLTTQLYFAGQARNRADPIFVPETAVRLRRESGSARAAFDFVVEGR
jgi:protocatechuate 3,4-dioxygenase beta subunit